MLLRYVELRCFVSTVGVVYSVTSADGSTRAIVSARSVANTRVLLAFRVPRTRHYDSTIIHLLALDAQSEFRSPVTSRLFCPYVMRLHPVEKVQRFAAKSIGLGDDFPELESIE